MSDETQQDRRIRELWQNQKTEGVRMSVAEVQAGAGKFQRRIKSRNTREYVASIVVVAFFGFEFWRAGALLVRYGNETDAGGGKNVQCVHIGGADDAKHIGHAVGD